MELRQRIAANRHMVNAALEERWGWREPSSADPRAVHTQWFVQELQLVQEALRGALADVDSEQDRRADAAARAREHRILDSTRWATWAAFSAAAAAVVASFVRS